MSKGKPTPDKIGTLGEVGKVDNVGGVLAYPTQSMHLCTVSEKRKNGKNLKASP